MLEPAAQFKDKMDQNVSLCPSTEVIYYAKLIPTLA
jgi:hypothetical protein